MSTGADPLWVVRCGTLGYEQGVELQERVAAARGTGAIPDVLLQLEHWPVLTKGRRTDPAELGMGEDWYRMQGIEVVDADRGGRVTYHGPGQHITYPIIDLAPYRDDVGDYVRRLERVMIETLDSLAIPAQVFAGLTGVWTAGAPPIEPGSPGPQGTTVGEPLVPGEEGDQARKIGSIGIHIRKGITTHGIAINVNNDLQPFEWVTPCGIDSVRMTSVARERRSEYDLTEFADAIAGSYTEIFERAPELVGLEQLDERLPKP